MKVGEKGGDFCRIRCTNLATSLNTVGMKKQRRSNSELTEQESRVVERLRKHPEMMTRVESILELAYDEEGPIKTADEVEELLVQEIRRLGNTTMNQWASHAEERVSAELKREDPTVRSRKKKR